MKKTFLTVLSVLLITLGFVSCPGSPAAKAEIALKEGSSSISVIADNFTEGTMTLVLTLKNAEFKDVAANAAAGWFDEEAIPAGFTVTNAAVAATAKATSLEITISGKSAIPVVKDADDLSLAIPAEALSTGKPLDVDCDDDISIEVYAGAKSDRANIISEAKSTNSSGSSAVTYTLYGAKIADNVTLAKADITFANLPAGFEYTVAQVKGTDENPLDKITITYQYKNSESTAPTADVQNATFTVAKDKLTVNDITFDAGKFYVRKDTTTATIANDVTVNGTNGTALASSVEFTVTFDGDIVGADFPKNDAESGEPVDYSALLGAETYGLTVNLKNDVSMGAKSVTFVISGTPNKVSTDAQNGDDISANLGDIKGLLTNTATDKKITMADTKKFTIKIAAAAQQGA